MEADEISTQKTFQDDFTVRELAKFTAAWEGCMQKESDLGLRLTSVELFSEHMWQKHEVVVVNPYSIAVLNIFDNVLSKQPVNFDISLPRFFFEVHVVGVVVKQGPENSICTTSQRRRDLVGRSAPTYYSICCNEDPSMLNPPR